MCVSAVICFTFVVKQICIQESYNNFLHENFAKDKYSNKVVNFANHTKFFYTKIFLHVVRDAVLI